ncbi:hypothetical protein WDZ92_06435 [Nostoc sp. NIES-2111]
MSQNVDFNELSSTAVRAARGIRILSTALQKEGGSSEGGVIEWLWNAAFQLGGFIVANASKIISFTASAVWGIITNTAQFIYNFNWNATDQELDQQVQAKWAALSGRLGGVLGKAVGYLACGVLPGSVIFVYNAALGTAVLKEVAEELADEMIQEIGDLCRTTLRAAIETGLIWQYKNVRNFIKSNAQLVGRIFGENAEKIIKSWGAEGSTPWSFALQNEAFLDSIPNTALREFIEEFQEEAWEGCVEAGYVVANSLDNYFAQQKLANEIASPLGGMRYVEIQPNRQVPTEKYIVAGKEELVKAQVVELIARTNHIKEKDIGTVYGTPPEAFPERRHKPEVVLQFYEEKADRVGKSGKPLTMQISFRLMNKSIDDFATNEYALELAKRIWSKFATPAFKHKKGKLPISYTDHEKGYQLLVWADNVIDARRVVEQVLDIQGHTVDDEKLKRASVRASTGQAVDPTPDKVTVLGKRVELPQKGKEGIVTFRKAYINLGVAVPPIELINRGGKKKGTLYNGG